MVLVFLAFVLWQGVKLLRKWPIVMPLAALALQFLGFSGFCYNLINGRFQMFGLDQQGRLQFVMPGNRGQHLGEGLIASSLIVLSGICMIMLAQPPVGKLFSAVCGYAPLNLEKREARRQFDGIMFNRFFLVCFLLVCATGAVMQHIHLKCYSDSIDF